MRDYEHTDIAAGYMTCSCSDEAMIQVQVKVKLINLLVKLDRRAS